MIRHVNLKNFKAWRELDIEFGPRITGLFGTNSSGKSSLIQFLLMLKETKNNPDRNLVLDFGEFGKLINLGGFGDVIHHNDEKRTLGWRVSWDAEKERRLQDTTKGRNTTLVFSKAFSTESEVAILEGAKSLKTQFIKYTIGDMMFGIERKPDKDSSFDLTVKRGKGEDFNFLRIQGRAWELPGPIKTHRFPDQAKTYYQNADLLSDLEVAYEDLMDRVFYLGPLRDYPRRQYNWSGGSPLDVGVRGESTINAILAASENGNDYQMKKRGRKLPFQEVVALRLKEMGLIHSFSVAEIAKGSNIYQARVARDRRSPEVLLTDVGFGVSQVLPAIVLLNYVPKNSIVVFEQPEIHLHPEVQSNLADTIIEIANTRDLQVIVESHSEHLLRRLQRRVAEETISADLVKLYFVSQESGEARLMDIGLNEYGEIENWPEHFFGDEMEEIAETRKAAIVRKMKAEE